MKIQSMTGFGKAEKAAKDFYARVEIKSVNNRYLETQFKLPKNLMGLESKLRTVLEESVSRGSIFCFIQYEPLKGGNSLLRVNNTLLDDYLKIIHKLKRKIDGAYSVDISEIMKIPDMVTVIPQQQETEVLESHIVPVFRKACQALKEMRLSEGKRLVDDVLKRAVSFKVWTSEMKKLLPGRQSDYLEKARARIEGLIKNKVVPDEDRLMTELGILSEKLDITEEIVRFESHVAAFLATVKKQETPGKKLGFLLQEMLREINTLGSKGQSSDIQHRCVSMKENLEIIREQIQNLE